MINIHPEIDLNEHIVAKASFIVEYLNENNGKGIVDTVLTAFMKSNMIMDPNEFFDALCFLFALDFIEYKNDSIRIKK